MHYYTSDTHQSHKLLAKLRGFDSIEAMNEVLLNNINAVVKENDILYHLGDFAFGNKRIKGDQLKNAISFRKGIKCKKIVLLFGNHERYVRRKPAFLELFNQTADLLEIYDPILKRDLVLCHYAMLKWNKSHYGATAHLHGHSHGKLNPWIEQQLPGALMLDVGVDCNNLCPFSSHDINNLIQAKLKLGIPPIKNH